MIIDCTGRMLGAGASTRIAFVLRDVTAIVDLGAGRTQVILHSGNSLLIDAEFSVLMDRWHEQGRDDHV